MAEQLTRIFTVLVIFLKAHLIMMLYKVANAMMYCEKVYSARDRKSFSGAKLRQNKARLEQKPSFELLAWYLHYPDLLLLAAPGSSKLLLVAENIATKV